ncbi:MAG: LTA synthase family protein [Chitinophagaceae bacterium]
MVILNFIDLEFFKIKTRRSGIELFQLISDPANPILSYIFNYWWLLLLLIGISVLLIYLYPKPIDSPVPPSLSSRLSFFFIALALLFMGARGSFDIKPLRSFDAAAFVDPQWVAATINSPTQLLTSYSTQTPKKVEWLSDQDERNNFNPVFYSTPTLSQKPNIVLIILESFGRDYIGFLNKEPRFTPFLDSLSKQALVFPHAYSSGTTSMESLPAIFASVPSLLEVPYINSNFQNNTLKGLHHFLPDDGYDCSFYYGARNGSMGFDNFLKISGNIQYYGLDEYPEPEKDFDGHWGIWDEPYLQYFATQLTKKHEPFFSSVFTLSSHDPYQIPEQYRSIFTANELPIHKAVQYTDHALRQFFKKVWKMKYFDNTVFIITADHPSHSKNEYYYTPTGKYEIPLLIYGPKFITPGWNDSITASHTDIMPTILGLAGNEQSIFSYGKDVMKGKNSTAINIDNGMVQLIDYPYCLRRYPDGSFKMHVQPKYTPNTRIRYTLTPSEQERQKQLEKELMAKYQTYINRLLINHFYLE